MATIINPVEAGFDAFRTGFPTYNKSIFKNKVEIVTDGMGTIIGVTNSDHLYFANLPNEAEEIQILEVGKGAFASCKKLRTISFSSNLEIIGEEAFKGDENLTSIKLPSTLYELGEAAFEKTGIVSFVFPDGVTTIPPRLFIDDKKLESVVLNNVNRIGILAFGGCTSLSSIKISERIKEIPEGCFISSGLKEIFLPRSIRRIGSSAFSSCAFLTSIYFDGDKDAFRRIDFGKNWNRGLNSNCSLYLKNEKGEWYNAFKRSSNEDYVHDEKEEKIKKALGLFGFDSIPSLSVLKSVYHKKTLAFHPDRISSLNLDKEFTSFAEKRFCEYKEAYDLLQPLCK